MAGARGRDEFVEALVQAGAAADKQVNTSAMVCFWSLSLSCGEDDDHKVRSQRKKNDIIWEFFPNVGPPPLLGTPYPKKNFSVYFAF